MPWDVSSVGSEHRLDRAGVTGSSPVHPTPKAAKCGFLHFDGIPKAAVAAISLISIIK